MFAFQAPSYEALKQAADKLAADARNLAITPEPVFLPGGYLVYVTSSGPTALTVIRTDTHAVSHVEPGSDGDRVTITPDGTKAYVSDGFMKVIDVATHQWVDSVPYLNGPKAMIGDSMGPDDTDADGIIDQVDGDPNSYSNAFSDGTSSGTILNRAGQWVSVWGAFENGFYANARGSTGQAHIQACSISVFLDHNGAVKFLCGSLTLEVFAGQVEIGLVDEHYAAVPEGGEVKVERTFHGAGRTEGEFLLQNPGSETVSIIDAAGSILATLNKHCIIVFFIAD